MKEIRNIPPANSCSGYSREPSDSQSRIWRWNGRIRRSIPWPPPGHPIQKLLQISRLKEVLPVTHGKMLPDDEAGIRTHFFVNRPDLFKFCMLVKGSFGRGSDPQGARGQGNHGARETFPLNLPKTDRTVLSVAKEYAK